MFPDRNSGTDSQDYVSSRLSSGHLSPSLSEIIPFQHKVTGMTVHGQRAEQHSEWDRRLLQPPHHFPDSKHAASLRLWLSRMFVASVDVKPVSAKFRLKIFPEIITTMIFTWRFPHNISHYLPLNVVSVKTPLMVRDEFYIQRLFHLKIHFLIL